MKYVLINPSKLKGEVKIPPSKSISHRAIICAGLSNGTTNIKNVAFSEDIKATCSAISSLGVSIEKEGYDVLKVKGKSNLNVIKDNINCFKSGSTLRFLIPLTAITGEKVTFHGEGKLVERPLTPYYDIFKNHNIFYKNEDGKLPLTLKGKLKPGEYKLRGDISSQFITGLLFSLPLLDGDSKIIITTNLESKPYVDLTLYALNKFSIHVYNNDYKEFIVKGNQKYKSCTCNIEGDFSQVVFWAAAGILGEEIMCKNVYKYSIQGDKVIIDILRDMGAKIETYEDHIIVKPSKTHGITIDASQCPDLVPALAALASVSLGTTNIINAERLRFKECDRLSAISSELNKIGAVVEEKKDGLLIIGKETLRGGRVDSWDDHRIAMALACISSKCENPLIIENSECIKKSYPDFWKDFKKLGGSLDEWDMGK
ncbi:3-phosphoshikimate 1-carboxyvinyltransferase [Clostridium sp. JN-1]|jgi:3-phosphoshikimate 1-carboxyvinyltransferase|uniref:3-phosphoshikimate 1-carboxyvinyltransferase n=1 Tax=Clostridium sp. JN-1 TaxID=2483110 RepID=UPI000F0B342B|nr:3-phosphoshikimate 1-carboxyvinyltransferase [Clostridium sp. JN-1]